MLLMEKNALQFFRSWPNVPETLRPVHSRFLDAGLLWVDPNADSDGHSWPGQLRLTEIGQKLRDDYFEAFPSGTMNFFSETVVARLIPDPALRARIFKCDPEAAGFQVHGLTVRGKPESGDSLLTILEAASDAASRLTRRFRKLLP